MTKIRKRSSFYFVAASLLNGSVCAESQRQEQNIRSKTLQQKTEPRKLTSFRDNAIDSSVPHVDFCRCEYPGEEVYSREDLASGKEFAPHDFILLQKILILPPTHDGCKDVVFVCPSSLGQLVAPSTAWAYECPSLLDGNEREPNRNIRRRRDLSNTEGTGMMQRGLEKASTTKSHVVLQSSSDFCIQGGTAISSLDMLKPPCTKVELRFEKARDGQTVDSGSFVSSEWYPGYGVIIQGQGELHPMVLNSERLGSAGETGETFLSQLATPNAACGGNGDGDGGAPGAEGENCVPRGNVLVARERSPDPSIGEEDNLVLTFDFSQNTKVNSLSMINVAERGSVVQMIHEDGTIESIDIDTVGQNGYQTVHVGAANVQELSISMSRYAALEGIDICVREG